MVAWGNVRDILQEFLFSSETSLSDLPAELNVGDSGNSHLSFLSSPHLLGCFPKPLIQAWFYCISQCA